MFYAMTPCEVCPLSWTLRPEVANGGYDFKIWRISANILNKQSQTADKGLSSSPRVVLTGLLSVKYYTSQNAIKIVGSFSYHLRDLVVVGIILKRILKK
jgi:hypothetical protein